MLVKGKDEGENRSVEKLQQDSTEGVVSSSSVLVYLYLCVFNSTLKKRTKTSIVASLLLILPACWAVLTLNTRAWYAQKSHFLSVITWITHFHQSSVGQIISSFILSIYERVINCNETHISPFFSVSGRMQTHDLNPYSYQHDCVLYCRWAYLHVHSVTCHWPSNECVLA